MEITEGDMKACEILIRAGVTPHIAAMKALGISYDLCHRWQTEGADPDCEDGMKRAFFVRVEKARAVARGEAEQRVLLAEPRYFLTQGPAGRTRPNEPGWTEEQIVKHTDHTGDGPQRVVLEITMSGARTLHPARIETEKTGGA